MAGVTFESVCLSDLPVLGFISPSEAKQTGAKKHAWNSAFIEAHNCVEKRRETGLHFPSWQFIQLMFFMCPMSAIFCAPFYDRERKYCCKPVLWGFATAIYTACIMRADVLLSGYINQHALVMASFYWTCCLRLEIFFDQSIVVTIMSVRFYVDYDSTISVSANCRRLYCGSRDRRENKLEVEISGTKWLSLWFVFTRSRVKIPAVASGSQAVAYPGIES